MKKVFLITVTIMVMLLVTGCGKTQELTCVFFMLIF